MTTNNNQQNLTHQGWEDYYVATDKAAWKEQPEEFLTENLKLLAPSNKRLTILDIACGDGRNTFLWSDAGHVVFCNDIAATALKRIQEQRQTNVPLLLAGDFMQLPLLNNQFDIIQCFDGLPQMPDVPKAIQKMIDFTSPGGQIIFNVFTPNDVAFGKGEQISENAFVYKDTLFSFYTLVEVQSMLPEGVSIVKHETRKWIDPPHGDFRPYTHEHEAIFIIIKKQI